MEDLQTIAYIVALLIWLIMRNYKKVQKNRPATGEPLPEEEMMTGEEAMAEPVPVTTKPVPAGKVRKPAPGASRHSAVKPGPVVDQVSKDYDFAGGVSETGKVDSFYAGLENKMMENPPHNEQTNGWNLHAGNFDLRMAVLYSEILKRPVD